MHLRQQQQQHEDASAASDIGAAAAAAAVSASLSFLLRCGAVSVACAEAESRPLNAGHQRPAREPHDQPQAVSSGDRNSRAGIGGASAAGDTSALRTDGAGPGWLGSLSRSFAADASSTSPEADGSSSPSSSSSWLDRLTYGPSVSMGGGGGGSNGGDMSVRAWLAGAAAVAGVAAAVAAYIGYRRLFAPIKGGRGGTGGSVRVLGVIPARWGSSRFHGKPLAMIAGKPMIQRTWENAKLATCVDRVVVATDDERVATCCNSFGAEVIMTSPNCANGTERVAEAWVKLGGADAFDVVVNIQGDEPLLDSHAIDAVVEALLLHSPPSHGHWKQRRTRRNAQEQQQQQQQQQPKADEGRSGAAGGAVVAATAVADLSPNAAADPNRVKCVVDNAGRALYFSRALIPHNPTGTPNPDWPYMLHLGLHCFWGTFLQQYVALPPTRLEQEEQLEQLRILECGHRIAVVKVKHQGHGVDVPSDIHSVEAILARRSK